MDRKKITGFVKDDRIEGFFAVRDRQVREGARGPFLTIELGDSSGRISGVMWEPDYFAQKELESGMVVKVRGDVGDYRNKTQLTVRQIRLALDDEYALEDIMPHSSQTYEERKARVLALVDKIEDPQIRALTDRFFQDEEFFDGYLNAAAAKLWHHATIGGLSEHSANVAELCLTMAERYDFANPDQLIFGGLMHDAGKIASFTTRTVIDYTDEGRLVDHISMADQWICERARTVEDFPDRLLMKLRHLILSHHGQRDFGSPVVPQTAEAFLLNYCDEIDSKMGALARIRDRHEGKGWSDWVNLLDRRLYFGEGNDEQS